MVRYGLSLSVKGQTFLPDYLASILLFGLLVTFFFGVWNSVVQNQSEFDEEREMRSEAIRNTGFLVATPGFPENWDASTVQVPGFASRSNVLNTTKLEEFGSLSYQDQKGLLQVQNFQINISDGSQPIEVDGLDAVYGASPSNAETVVNVERNVLVNKSGDLVEAEVRFLQWE